ncbi:hypothetical protein F4679DRAFT_20308 [Xylaria curta]|nr:hypothetical protein F4679DRAFT_20308 [Xylaria curta]
MPGLGILCQIFWSCHYLCKGMAASTLKTSLSYSAETVTYRISLELQRSGGGWRGWKHGATPLSNAKSSPAAKGNECASDQKKDVSASNNLSAPHRVLAINCPVPRFVAARPSIFSSRPVSQHNIGLPGHMVTNILVLSQSSFSLNLSCVLFSFDSQEQTFQLTSPRPVLLLHDITNVGVRSK